MYALPIWVTTAFPTAALGQELEQLTEQPDFTVGVLKSEGSCNIEDHMYGYFSAGEGKYALYGLDKETHKRENIILFLDGIQERTYINLNASKDNILDGSMSGLYHPCSLLKNLQQGRFYLKK